MTEDLGTPRPGAPAARERRVSPAAWPLILPIRFYQKFITPYTPATCRYYPTCSAYAVGALRTHGAVKGLLLAAWRLLRCNPWSSGGVDRVPPRGRWRNPPAPSDSASDPAPDPEASSDGESGNIYGDDVAVGAGPRGEGAAVAFGRAAAARYVTSEMAVPEDRAVPDQRTKPDQGTKPDQTNGDGAYAAGDTARPSGACAPSAGRTAA